MRRTGPARPGRRQPADARAQHTAALDLATRIHDTYEQARAHAGLAAATRAAGDLGPARDHWQQARNLYARLGAPEAGPIGAGPPQLGLNRPDVPSGRL